MQVNYAFVKLATVKLTQAVLKEAVVKNLQLDPILKELRTLNSRGVEHSINSESSEVQPPSRFYELEGAPRGESSSGE